MRPKILLLFPLILLSLSICSRAQLWSGVLHPSRAIDWSHAGAGTIPNRATVCATLNPGATLAQINSAIASCPVGQVVYLNAGTYSALSGQILLNKGVTLRGAGPDKTFLVWSGNGGCQGFGADICVYNQDGLWRGATTNLANWTAGYAKGTTNITLSTVSNLKVGSLLVLDQLDDPTGTSGYYVCSTAGSCSWQGAIYGSNRSGRSQSQMVTVTACGTSTPGAACTSTSITISPGLYAPNWNSSKSPQAWWGTSLPVTGAGIEDMSLDHRWGTTNGIIFANAAQCWMKNVRSLGVGSNHVNFFQAAHNTVRDSYFYGGSGSSEGYGIDSSWSSADNLIENNISQHLGNFAVTEGDAGSVFAYNYAVDNYFGTDSNAANNDWQQNDATHHSAGDHYELFEGFEGVGQMLDIIHGTSNMVTAFRNRWSGLDSATLDGIKRLATIPYMALYGNRFSNAIGNVLGTAGYHNVYQNVPPSISDCSGSSRAIFSLGYSDGNGTSTLACAGAPGPGNDLELVDSVMRWGNYSVVTQSSDTPSNSGIRFVAAEVPSGNSYFPNPVPSSTTLPRSFYLSAKPAWWGAMPWPAVGPDVSGGDIANVAGHAYHNPAANCYLKVMGGKTDGSSGVLTFNATNCYGVGGSSGAPSPPTNLKVVVN